MTVSEVAFEVLMVSVPTVCVLWAWRKRVRPVQTWREQALIAALVGTTLDLVLYLTFVFWPWFGSRQGVGVALWERTLTLLRVGFWISTTAFLLALVATGKPARKLLIVLSIAGVAFWFLMLIPASDFLAVERARQSAIHVTR